MAKKGDKKKLHPIAQEIIDALGAKRMSASPDATALDGDELRLALVKKVSGPESTFTDEEYNTLTAETQAWIGAAVASLSASGTDEITPPFDKPAEPKKAKTVAAPEEPEEPDDDDDDEADDSESDDEDESTATAAADDDEDEEDEDDEPAPPKKVAKKTPAKKAAKKAAKKTAPKKAAADEDEDEDEDENGDDGDEDEDDEDAEPAKRAKRKSAPLVPPAAQVDQAAAKGGPKKSTLSASKRVRTIVAKNLNASLKAINAHVVKHSIPIAESEVVKIYYAVHKTVAVLRELQLMK